MCSFEIRVGQENAQVRMGVVPAEQRLAVFLAIAADAVDVAPREGEVHGILRHRRHGHRLFQFDVPASIALVVRDAAEEEAPGLVWQRRHRLFVNYGIGVQMGDDDHVDGRTRGRAPDVDGRDRVDAFCLFDETPPGRRHAIPRCQSSRRAEADASDRPGSSQTI
jgi:hypothetical protein